MGAEGVILINLLTIAQKVGMMGHRSRSSGVRDGSPRRSDQRENSRLEVMKRLPRSDRSEQNCDENLSIPSYPQYSILLYE